MTVIGVSRHPVTTVLFVSKAATFEPGLNVSVINISARVVHSVLLYRVPNGVFRTATRSQRRIRRFDDFYLRDTVKRNGFAEIAQTIA